MILKSFDEITGRVKFFDPKRVVVAGGEDEYALEAVFEAQKRGIVKPVWLGTGKSFWRILEN